MKKILTVLPIVVLSSCGSVSLRQQSHNYCQLNGDLHHTQNCEECYRLAGEDTNSCRFNPINSNPFVFNWR